MRRHKTYRITLEDRSRLKKIVQLNFTPSSLSWTVAGVVAASVIVGAILVMATPLRTLLPGYMKKSERTASLESIMKIDSLHNALMVNEAYLNNLMSVTDTSRQPDTSARADVTLPEISPEDILAPTEKERNFVRVMQEREKYHLSVIAPLAGEATSFSPVSERSVFLTETRESEEPVILLAADESVASIADGTVLAAYFSPAESGYVVVVQHPNGFASRFSRLGNPFVAPGDVVEAGQMIAATSRGDGIKGSRIKLRMWHDGIPVIPYQYLERSFKQATK